MAVRTRAAQRAQSCVCDSSRVPGARFAEWMTKDFMTSVAENRVLARALADPRTTEFLQEMQTNPQAAVKRMKVTVCVCV